jgi:hypothetical protein
MTGGGLTLPLRTYLSVSVYLVLGWCTVDWALEWEGGAVQELWGVPCDIRGTAIRGSNVCVCFLSSSCVLRV